MHIGYTQIIDPAIYKALCHLCIAGVSAFNLTEGGSKLWLFVSVYFIICYGGIALWALAGSRAKTFVKTSTPSGCITHTNGN
mgnify:CR=1 FL=1